MLGPTSHDGRQTPITLLAPSRVGFLLVGQSQLIVLWGWLVVLAQPSQPSFKFPHQERIRHGFQELNLN
jgi:hypothetical protein